MKWERQPVCALAAYEFVGRFGIAAGAGPQTTRSALLGIGLLYSTEVGLPRLMEDRRGKHPVLPLNSENAVHENRRG